MAQTYFPFDSGAGANATENQWSKMAQNWLGTGVIKSYNNELQVYADSTGMQTRIKTGAAWLKGHYFESDAEEVIAIGVADGTNPRIDRVIIRLDWSLNTIQLAILQGTPAVSPTAPALAQNSSRWEISLAQVYVGASVSTIVAGNITDERNFVKNANAIPEAWILLTLQNGWVNDISDFSTAAWSKNSFGELKLRGRVKSGSTTIGTVIATLPIGSRPSKNKSFPVISHNGSNAVIGQIDVNADGTIIYVAGGNYYLSLEGIPPIQL